MVVTGLGMGLVLAPAGSAEILLALTSSLATRKLLPAVAIQMNLQEMLLKGMAEVSSSKIYTVIPFLRLCC